MIVIGHSAIEFDKFTKIESINDISNTKANEVVWFNSNIDNAYHIAKHCAKNDISYAILAHSLNDVVIFANLDVKFIMIREKNLVENAQKVANEYFFDSKILYIINDESSIENLALLGIDGVIFNDILIFLKSKFGYGNITFTNIETNYYFKNYFRFY